MLPANDRTATIARLRVFVGGSGSQGQGIQSDDQLPTNAFKPMETNSKKPDVDQRRRGRGEIIIMGAGGHATSVANVAISAGYKIRYFIDPGVNETEIFGVSIKKRLAGLAGIEKCNFAIGIGDNSKRESVFLEVEQELGAVNFPCLVHEFAIISQFATLGEGSVIMPGAVVGPRTSIGRFCIVNTNASIDHDSIMLDYSSLAPGAVTGGKVEIGKRSAVCLGARVRDKLTIGADSVLGANSYLNKNLPDSQLAYGTPARLIRARSRNDGYL